MNSFHVNPVEICVGRGELVNLPFAGRYRRGRAAVDRRTQPDTDMSPCTASPATPARRRSARAGSLPPMSALLALLLAAVGAPSPARAQASTTSPGPDRLMSAPQLEAAASDAAHRDTPRDRRNPGGMALVGITSHGDRINAVLYRAAGPGPHPTLVLLHGFPGIEQNADLAHAARRAGWHVIAPRYRGAWGSGGTYSWTHVLEDAAAVVAWARTDTVARSSGIDSRTIAVAGHSLGGFVALMSAANDPAIAGAASFAGFDFGAYTAHLAGDANGVERTAAAWSDDAALLRGTSGRALAVEAFQHAAAWSLRAHAPALVGPAGGRPLLIVGATDDDVAPPALHFAPLVESLRGSGARALAARMLTADHSFADTRFAAADLLVAWLETIRVRGH